MDENPKNYTFGLEIVSPLFQEYNQFINEVERIFALIRKYGYTDESTGFHISISFKDQNQKIDLVKLILLVGEKYVAKLFGRETNDYCAQLKPMIIKHISNMEDFGSMSLENYTDMLVNSLQKHKDYSINISQLKNNGRIEFRMLGGAEYNEKIEYVKESIKRFFYILQIATDPDFERKTYLKKLGNLVSTAKERNYFAAADGNINNLIKKHNLGMLIRINDVYFNDIAKKAVVHLAQSLEFKENNYSDNERIYKNTYTPEFITGKINQYMSSIIYNIIHIDFKTIPAQVRRLKELVKENNITYSVLGNYIKVEFFDDKNNIEKLKYLGVIR